MSLKAMKQCWAPDFPTDAEGVAPALVLGVALAIADIVNPDHGYEFYGSVAKIATKAKVARRTATKVFAHLVSAGVLVVLDSRPGRTTRYRWQPEFTVLGSDAEADPSVIGTRVQCARVPESTVLAIPIETSTETQPTVNGPVTPAAPTPGQLAKAVYDGYFAWVKDQTGGKPPTIKAEAMMTHVLIPLFKAGWSRAEVGQALKAVHNSGRAIARQAIEAELQGRAPRNRSTRAQRLSALRFDEHGNVLGPTALR